MNAASDPKRPDKMVLGSRAQLVFSCAVSGLGMGLSAWSVFHLHPVREALLLVALVIVAELTTSESIAPQVSFSMSSAVIFATLLLTGPWPAILVSAVGGLFSTIAASIGRRGRPHTPFWYRATFNIGVLSLAAGAAGGVFVLAGGNAGEGAPLARLPAIVLAAGTLEITNALLVILAASLQTQSSPYQVWRNNVSWAVPIDILTMLIGGTGLALGYRIAGILGLGVFFLPIVLTIYAFRLFVAETRAHVAELESIIAQRRRVEQQLMRSLREKEVLLQEVHHRVKNNLQIISSMLYLRSKTIGDSQVRAALTESESRIRSIALVHERLYQSSDLSRVDFAQYIRSLASYLFRSYGVDQNVIGLEIEADVVSLSIESAIPCGLIVHEVISNSLKHAFPDGRKGTVRVHLHSAGDGTVVLAVGDDGIGLGCKADLQSAESLGLSLIRTLVAQLDGTVEVFGTAGTKYRIVVSDSADRLEAEK